MSSESAETESQTLDEHPLFGCPWAGTIPALGLGRIRTGRDLRSRLNKALIYRGNWGSEGVTAAFEPICLPDSKSSSVSTLLHCPRPTRHQSGCCVRQSWLASQGGEGGSLDVVMSRISVWRGSSPAQAPSLFLISEPFGRDCDASTLAAPHYLQPWCVSRQDFPSVCISLFGTRGKSRMMECVLEWVSGHLGIHTPYKIWAIEFTF